MRSKTIYEEALEDLYYVIPVGYPKDMIGKTIQTKRLLDFVKQAQKQEKLLKQYQKISSAIVRISIEQPIYVIKESERESVEQSFKIIREIENE